MPAIEFQNVGKMYRLGRVGTGSIVEDLNRWWQMKVMGKEDPYQMVGQVNDRQLEGNSEYVWALNDINFSVEQGEVIGIIGRNGSGKSTLLKLLSNITSPTKGVIRITGRVSSLLEVGTGFHPELTGRENIYMNGAVLGMTKAEINQKFNDIVDFSGIGRYIDTPVKRYSSGMIVRLGFSVAAFLDPEILVVDEVLTVGDADFQAKAMQKMQELSHAKGRTVFFVSHNLEAVKALCLRGIVLENGLMKFDGPVNDAVACYRNVHKIEETQTLCQGLSWIVPYMTINNIVLNGTTFAQSIIESNQETLDLLIEGTTSQSLPALDVRLEFRNPQGVILASLAEGHYRNLTHAFQPGSFRIHKQILLPKYLAAGDYSIDIVLHQPNVCLYMQALSCATIHVEGSRDALGDALISNRDGFFGLISKDLL